MNTAHALTIAFTAGTLLLASGCGKSPPEVNPQKSNTGLDRVVNVTVKEVSPRTFAETINLTGVLKAVDDVVISPEEGGVVKEWIFAKGAYVRKGEVVVVLKDDVARPSYDASRAQYNTAQLNYEKQQKVYTEQAVSEMQLKTSEYARDAAKANADLMHARLERTQLRAPVSGIMDERYVDEGEMAPPGAPIARIVNIAMMKVVISVPERYAGAIARNTPVTFTVMAFPGQTYTGKISYVGAALSPDNRTFPVELLVDNSRHRLKPEMIANATVARSAERNAILVEESIIQQLDANKLVVYVEREGRAHERVVTLGGHRGSLIEVVSGLSPGDRVVTSGYQTLVDGQRVTVVQ